MVKYQARNHKHIMYSCGLNELTSLSMLLIVEENCECMKLLTKLMHKRHLVIEHAANFVKNVIDFNNGGMWHIF